MRHKPKQGLEHTTTPFSQQCTLGDMTGQGALREDLSSTMYTRRYDRALSPLPDTSFLSGGDMMDLEGDSAFQFSCSLLAHTSS